MESGQTSVPELAHAEAIGDSSHTAASVLSVITPFLLTTGWSGIALANRWTIVVPALTACIFCPKSFDIFGKRNIIE